MRMLFSGLIVQYVVVSSIGRVLTKLCHCGARFIKIFSIQISLSIFYVFPQYVMLFVKTKCQNVSNILLISLSPAYLS